MVDTINLNMNLTYVTLVFYLRLSFADNVVAEGLGIRSRAGLARPALP